MGCCRTGSRAKRLDGSLYGTATLVNSLDARWIRSIKTEFDNAINFTRTRVNMLGTNIRHVDGFL